MARLVLFNKPFNVLCQFTDQEGRMTLADWIDLKGVYAAGRLDRDSEGLVLLTDDGQWQARIASPGDHKMAKTYLVQVEGNAEESQLEQLRQGIALKDGQTRPIECQQVSEPEWLWERDPPIRSRQNIPTSWLEMTLMEGRNRQVRRMTAAVGLPTLRLVRISIGPYSLLDTSLPELTNPGGLHLAKLPDLVKRRTVSVRKNKTRRRSAAREQSPGSQYRSGKSRRPN